MAAAVVGDDVMREDPTVQQLEQSTARLLGKEAGLFVPSGTMGNLISVLVHCNERGSEYIVGDQAHIYWYEQGGPAQVGGAHPRPVRTNPDGTLPLDELAAAIRSYDDHYPVTKLICLGTTGGGNAPAGKANRCWRGSRRRRRPPTRRRAENTHNRCGGRVLPTSYVDAVGALARQHQLKVHIDGARLMNAAAALKEDPAAMVRSADSVSLCLSKGLGAPVGSVIVGTNEFVERARRYRKGVRSTPGPPASRWHRGSDVGWLRALPGLALAAVGSAGRRHAASRRARGGGRDRAGDDAAPPGRGPRQRPAVRRRPRRAAAQRYARAAAQY